MRKSMLIVLPVLALAGCHNHDDARHAATPAPVAPSQVLAGRTEAGHPVIVRLVGRTKTLTVTSTAAGPAYSVTSPAGQPLLTQGTLDDLRRQHPDLYRQVRQGLVSTAAPVSPRDDADGSLDYLLHASSASSSR
jgi:hypothetical protein